jgi:hypothetical protein
LRRFPKSYKTPHLNLFKIFASVIHQFNRFFLTPPLAGYVYSRLPSNPVTFDLFYLIDFLAISTSYLPLSWSMSTSKPLSLVLPYMI